MGKLEWAALANRASFAGDCWTQRRSCMSSPTSTPLLLFQDPDFNCLETLSSNQARRTRSLHPDRWWLAVTSNWLHSDICSNDRCRLLLVGRDDEGTHGTSSFAGCASWCSMRARLGEADPRWASDTASASCMTRRMLRQVSFARSSSLHPRSTRVANSLGYPATSSRPSGRSSTPS